MKISNHLSLSSKPDSLRQLINQTLDLLVELGIPIDGLTSRRLERMALVFLAVANIKTSGEWQNIALLSHNHALKTREIIDYINHHFQENIASGSYDDIRRKDLKLLVEAGIVRNRTVPGAARNDPTRAYELSDEYKPLISKFGLESWESTLFAFLGQRETLRQKLSASKEMLKIPVKLPDGQDLQFSPGQHNLLQKAIIEEFLPRFGSAAELLYVGDTADKFLFINREKLHRLKFFELAHGELPDILAYSEIRNWLFVIEAVYSSGPIDSIRKHRLTMLTSGCTAEIIYVTAFPDRKTFRKFSAEIAWETEAWVAEEPDHLIHFNGSKFLGAYPSPQG